MLRTPISAVILSAGLSSRMGEFKPLLPLGKKTVIERVVGAFQQADIHDIHIVIGNRASDMISMLKGMPVSWIINNDYRQEMFTSVRAGVGGLSPEAKAFFIQPVDIPLVRSQTLKSLIKALRSHPQWILYPSFNGHRGHPPLIPRRYTQGISDYQGNGGLKGFLQQYDQRAQNIPVADAGILMDMDTPEQYERIKTRYQKWMVPSTDECMAMMTSRFTENHPVVQHGRVVARLVEIIGTQLNHAGGHIDVDLLMACGYLHDIGKGEKEHAQYGADLIRLWGYVRIGDIIETHMDLDFDAQRDVTEKEILYLADKKTSGDKILSLKQRLQTKMKQFAKQPEGRIAAEKRLRTAMKIEHTIEKIIGQNLDELIKNRLY
jgi:molybdenum cofactor cytidylyltransferase